MKEAFTFTSVLFYVAACSWFSAVIYCKKLAHLAGRKPIFAIKGLIEEIASRGLQRDFQWLMEALAHELFEIRCSKNELQERRSWTEYARRANLPDSEVISAVEMVQSRETNVQSHETLYQDRHKQLLHLKSMINGNTPLTDCSLYALRLRMEWCPFR